MTQKNNAELKLVDNTVTVKLITILKKYRNDAISNIRNDITNGATIFGCSFSGDEENFASLVNLYDELVAAGYQVELIEHGRVSNITFFKNWLNTLHEISAEIDEAEII